MHREQTHAPNPCRPRLPGTGTASFIAGLPLFRNLDHGEIGRIALSAVPVTAPQGSILFRRGEPCSGFHIVIAGQVKLSLQNAKGGEKVIEILGSGQSFGEAVMFLEKDYMVSAETLTNSRLLHVPRTAIFAELDRSPQLARRMIASLSMRLHHLMRDLESYSLHSGTQRVIGYLLSLTGATEHGEARIVLPVRKNVIASRLNLTHEHFSRILHTLAAAGLVQVEGQQITIPDLAKLCAHTA